MRSVVLLFVMCVTSVMAMAQDTVVVRTLKYDDITKRSGTWLFPPKQPYEKVLMEYRLKCDPQTTQDQYPCGEWDYLTYTFVTDSSGVYDSTAKLQVNYVVRNATPDSFAYTTAPYIPQKQYVNINATRAYTDEEAWIQVGTGGQNNNSILTTKGGWARYVYKASELTAAGLVAGPISSLKLKVSATTVASLFTISIAQKAPNTAVPFGRNNDGFQQVVRRNINFVEGTNRITFSQPFQWDGTSDIWVDYSCYAASVNANIESGSTSIPGVADDGSRKAYSFKSGDQIEVDPEFAKDLGTEITIAFWSYGTPSKLPSQNNAFEAFDEQGRRVLNAHLPWENGNVYWDAGRDLTTGSLDRLEKAALEQSYEGTWNHWAFVKNGTTGNMQIYLNGKLFHSGTNKRYPISGITKMIVGSGGAGSYPGMIDEFQIWNIALDSNAIIANMSRKQSPSNPQFENLLVYFSAENDPSNTVANDGSGNGNHGKKLGIPTVTSLSLEQIGYMVLQTSTRPQIQLDTTVKPVTIQRTNVRFPGDAQLTSVQRFNRAVQQRIYRPADTDYPSVATDTLLVQEAGWQPIYDENGIKVDSAQVVATETIRKSVKTFFDPVVNFEIGRYITPYGIGLDLGPEGFKWVFDVTDYAPLFHDNVTLSAGNQQELIDLRFVFIKGTPVREVTRIDQLWSLRDYQCNYADVVTNKVLEPLTVALNNKSQTYNVKTRTTGHRFGEPSNCAEFCQRKHNISVNGEKKFEWLLWNECASNPVYPQGGTWTLDRAGWCPGDAVGVYNHEITPYVTTGNTVVLDYGIENDQSNGGQGQWDVTAQLIGYGKINHVNDVAIEDIVAPNTWEYYKRVNPICGEPIIIIKNNGSANLTSCTITYNAGFGADQVFNWKGQLKFAEKDTVVLPPFPVATESGSHTFTVTLSQPNNAADEYSKNNSSTQRYTLPPVYYSNLQMQLRTNKQAASQYQWYLRKVGGDIVQQGSNLASETLYVHDFNLENGCYEFELRNVEGFGLDLWFVRQQLGTGSLQFTSDGNPVRTFSPDFGNTAWMQFTVAPKPTVRISPDTLTITSPDLQPAQETLKIFSGSDAPLRVDSVTVFNAMKHFEITSISRPLPAILNPGDTIDVVVTFSRPDAGKSSGTMRVYNNDERALTKTIRVIGNAGSTGITETLTSELLCTVVPNPVISSGELVIFNNSGTVIDGCTVIIADMLGRTVHTLQNVVIDSETTRISLTEPFGAGAYTATVQAGATRITTNFVVVK